MELSLLNLSSEKGSMVALLRSPSQTITFAECCDFSTQKGFKCSMLASFVYSHIYPLNENENNR